SAITNTASKGSHRKSTCTHTAYSALTAAVQHPASSKRSTQQSSKAWTSSTYHLAAAPIQRQTLVHSPSTTRCLQVRSQSSQQGTPDRTAERWAHQEQPVSASQSATRQTLKRTTSATSTSTPAATTYQKHSI